MSNKIEKTQWATMSKEERAAFKAERKSSAVALIKEGLYPPCVPFKVGQMTLTATPTGVSELGNVSYGYAPGIIRVQNAKGEEVKVRINQFSVTVLGTTKEEQALEDLPTDNALVF